MKKTLQKISEGLLILTILSGFGQPGALGQSEPKLLLKKTIAIIPLEDKVGAVYEENGLNTKTETQDITEMLSTELVNTNKYQVIEREQIEKILKEQGGLSQSGQVIPGVVTQKLQNSTVQLVIMGSVTECGFSGKSSGFEIKGIQLSKGVLSGRVAVDLRIINVATGEVVFASRAVGLQKINNSSIKVNGTGGHSGATYDFSLIGKAKHEAVMKCVEYITNAMTNIRWEGKVIQVNGDGNIFMKPGSAGGVKSNMEFVLYSKGKEVIDPDNGQSLGSKDIMIGKIKVINDIGNGQGCEAKILQITPGKSIKKGDILRTE